MRETESSPINERAGADSPVGKGNSVSAPSDSTEAKAFPAIVMVIAIVMLVFTFNPRLGDLSDCARYFLVGQSIAAGTGFTMVWRAGAPPEVLSAPLFPYLIALLSSVFFESIILVKAVNGLMYVIFVALFYRLSCRLVTDNREAFAITLLTALNYHILRYSSIMMSEMLYLLLSTAALLYALRSDENGGIHVDRNFSGSLIASLLAFLTRMSGLPLLAASSLDQFRRGRRRRLSITILFYGVFAAPWLLRGMTSGGLSHFDLIFSSDRDYPLLIPADFGDYAWRLVENTRLYLSKIVIDGIVPAFKGIIEAGSPAGFAAGMFIIAAAVFGASRLAAGRRIIITYFAVYCLMLAAFPTVFTGTRLFLPILPIFILLFIHGLYCAAEKLPDERLRRSAPAAFAGLLLVLSLANVGSLHREVENPPNPEFERFVRAAIWAGDNLPREAVVATVAGEIFYIYSFRATAPLSYEPDPDVFISSLIEYGVDYLLVDEVDWRLEKGGKLITVQDVVLPAMEKYPPLFTELFRVDDSDTRIFYFPRRELKRRTSQSEKKN